MKKFLLIFAAAMAALTISAKDYDLYVGGVRVTDSNKDNITGSNIKAFDTSKACKVTYDSGNNKLTLTNVRIERTGSGNRAIQNNGVEYLAIIFDGANYLSAKDQGTIKLDKHTFITSKGGKDDATTYIYGGSEDGLCVFNGANCFIQNANLHIESSNSDAIWADSQKEQLWIANSNIVAVSKKSDGHAIYNFIRVEVSNSNLALRAPKAEYAMCNIKYYAGSSGIGIHIADNSKWMKPSNVYTTTSGVLANEGTVYLNTKGDDYDPNVGFVLEAPLVEIDAEHFPDEEFRVFLKGQPEGSNGYLYKSEITNFTQMNLSGRAISNITGIEYFPNLKVLLCNGNKLTSLNLSKNTQLTTLYCQDNQLTSLNVSGCNNLTRIDAYGNKLRGTGMTNFIKSLPKVTGSVRYVNLVNHASSDEQNRFTNADWQIINGYAWRLCHNLTTSPNWTTSTECVDYDDLWVGGKLLNTCETIDGVSYDPYHEMLTIRNANITGQNITTGLPYGWAIFSRLENLILIVEGESTIKSYNASNAGIVLEGNTAILVNGDGTNAGKLSIEGNPAVNSRSGNLTITSTDTKTAEINLKALMSSGLRGSGGSTGGCTLTLSGNIAVSGNNTVLGSVITNWSNLVLKDGLHFSQPAGVTYDGSTLLDADGNELGVADVVISAAKLGDVNLDGEINSADVVAIYNYIIDGEASGIAKALADVDGDGEVGTADVVAVYNIIINGGE